MQSAMRFRLGNAIAYHEQMAEACKDGDSTLSETHAEAAKQLQDVLRADPIVTGVARAVATQTVHRNTRLAPHRRPNLPPRRRVH